MRALLSERGIKGMSQKSKKPCIVALQDWDRTNGETLDVEADTKAVEGRWAGKHAMARLLHCFVASTVKDFALKMNSAPSRVQLDNSSERTAWDVFWRVCAQLFNDRTWKIKHRLDHDTRFKNINPNHESVFGASAATMQTHFRAFKRDFSEIYSNYTQSGHNNADIEDYCHGNIMVHYGFLVLEQDKDNLCPLFCVELPGEVALDTFTPINQTKAESKSAEPRPKSSAPKSSGKKRKKSTGQATGDDEDELQLLRQQHVESMRDIYLQRIKECRKNEKEASAEKDDEMYEVWRTQRLKAQEDLKALD